MIFDPFDVVTVPFPFTDSSQTKKRPALVLSSGEFNLEAGHTVMAMITSAKNSPWPLDIRISDLTQAGLPAESVVRMKFFTLDNRFVIARIGALSRDDQQNLLRVLKTLFFS